MEEDRSKKSSGDDDEVRSQEEVMSGKEVRAPLTEAELEEKVVMLRSLLRNDTLASRLLKPKDLETSSLRRFVRARDGNVDAAFDQAVNVLKWRKDHKVDLILERDYEFVAQDRWGMAYWHGTDKSGRPILVIRGCRHDPALFDAQTTIRYLIWKLETKLFEPEVDDVVLIVDCVNTTRHNLDTKLMLKLIPLLQNFYPERLGVCFVYPTLPIVWVLWKMISKRFDEKTEKKFVFVREQKRDNKFLKLIDAEQLQERFGGTSKEEFGVDGLGLAPPETFKSAPRLQNFSTAQNTTATDASSESTSSSSPSSSTTPATSPVSASKPFILDPDPDAECLGPSAFEDLSGQDQDFDHESAIRQHTGSLFDEDDEFKDFLSQREKAVDRFQLRLRYQVADFRVEGRTLDELESGSAETSQSPRSDIGGTTRSGDLKISESSSEASMSRRGKRAKMKRFIRRHLLRRKSFVNDTIAEEGENGNSASDHSKTIGSAQPTLQPPMDEGSQDERIRMSRTTVESDHVEFQRTGLRRSVSGDKSPLLHSPRRLAKKVSSGLFGSPLLKKQDKSIVHKTDTAAGLLGEVKFVMEAGASMKKVDRDDPSREVNCWSQCDASRYETRIGPDYKKNKKKAPSGTAVYECVCCDVWQLERKRPHIASYMQLPDLTDKHISPTTQVAPLPELLIVNMMMPGYPPSGPFSKKRVDGPGQSIVLFARLGEWAKNHPEDPAVQLWSRFVHAHDGDPFRERLKMITRLENKDEIEMGRLESKLLNMYNGKPWLVRPEYEFHKGRGYFEIDIDYHLFKYFVLSNALPVLDRVHNAILDCALMIQAEKDQEMPERVLVCTTIRCLNLREAPEIDLVQMDKSKQKARLKSMGTSFIDRDGVVHALHPSTDRPSEQINEKKTSESRTSVTSSAASLASSSSTFSSASSATLSQSGRGDGKENGSVSLSDRAKPFFTSFLHAGLFFALVAFVLSYLASSRAAMVNFSRVFSS